MEIPIGNIVTAVATVLAVVIANKLTLARSSAEKMWDLRRQSYGVILSELARVDRIIRDVDAILAIDLIGYFQSKLHNTHQEKMWKHINSARQRFDDDYLVLSQEFIELFQNMEARLEIEDDPNDTPPEQIEKYAEIIKEVRPKLVAQARKEMTLKSSWQHRFGVSR
jgi:hypothetical protein